MYALGLKQAAIRFSWFIRAEQAVAVVAALQHLAAVLGLWKGWVHHWRIYALLLIPNRVLVPADPGGCTEHAALVCSTCM